MPKLVVTVEDQLLSEWPLDDQEVLIGRGPDCHVVVRDPLVSRHHAKIAKAYGGYFVEDLESTNGVIVNGRRVRKQMLKYGDKVQIGTHDLCLTAESADSSNDTEKTVAITPSSIAPSSLANHFSTPESLSIPPPSLATSSREPQRSGRAYVKYNTGPNAGESEQIVKSLYSIGAPGGNLAVISRRGQVYVLQHLGGKKMSTLNREPVSSAGVPLKDGDHIQVGDTQLEFHLGDP